jgi:hypothetical protein
LALTDGVGGAKDGGQAGEIEEAAAESDAMHVGYVIGEDMNLPHTVVVVVGHEQNLPWPIAGAARRGGTRRANEQITVGRDH